jgi:hypothetical protein
MLLRLDPNAADAAFGQNLAAETDGQLGHPARTSKEGFATLLGKPLGITSVSCRAS